MYHGKVNVIYDETYKNCSIETAKQSSPSYYSPKVPKEILLDYVNQIKDYFLDHLTDHNVQQFDINPSDGFVNYRGYYEGEHYRFWISPTMFQMSVDTCRMMKSEDLVVDFSEVRSQFDEGFKFLMTHIEKHKDKVPDEVDIKSISGVEVNKLLNSANNIQRLKLMVTEESKNHLVVYWNGIETCIQKAGFKSEVIPHKDRKYIREVTEKEFPKVKSGIISAIYKELN